MMSLDAFNAIEMDMSLAGAESALKRLIQQLREEHEYHLLFDALLMKSRYHLGVPVDHLEMLQESDHSRCEASYLAACREVGQLLLGDGRFREAWMYLKTTGEMNMVQDALDHVQPNKNNLEELLEVALYEGVSPAHGFKILLEHYGTCNAITTFETVLLGHKPSLQQIGAEQLVRRLHAEITENVRVHVEKHQGQSVVEKGLGDLVLENPDIFANDCYHIDISHLSSVVRFSRILTKKQPLQLALELAEYGSKLSQPLQHVGDEPFVDFYRNHALFFAASLGKQVDKAINFFAHRAQTVSVTEQGTGTIETYLILLNRLGRAAEALEAWSQVVPPDVSLSDYAPTMLDLARQTNQWPRYLEICRQRGDRLAFTAGLVEAAT